MICFITEKAPRKSCSECWNSLDTSLFHLFHASMSLTSRKVSQDRLEFWQDALNIAVNKRKEPRSYGFPFFGATPMVISVSSILERIEDHFDR